MRRQETGPLLAILAMTAVWGSTFFMVKDLVTRIPVADLLAVRFAIAALVLAAFAGRRIRMGWGTFRAGVYLGLLYGSAQLFQTYGLEHTPASVSGFVTGLYVVLTPLLSAVIFRTRITRTVWVAAILATAGLAVLSLNGFSIGPGELLTLVSAVLYALHIIAVGRFSQPGDALQLSLVQMAVMCGVVAAPGGIQLPTTAPDWIALIYYAAIAGSLTMVLQVWAQARVDASRAAIIIGNGTGLGDRLCNRFRRRIPHLADGRRRGGNPDRHVSGRTRPGKKSAALASSEAR